MRRESAAFIDAILADGARQPFPARTSSRCSGLVAHCGMFTSLSQTLLKIASPGVPDFYQGTELWEFQPGRSRQPPPGRLSHSDGGLDALKKREAEVGPRELIRELLSDLAGRQNKAVSHLSPPFLPPGTIGSCSRAGTTFHWRPAEPGTKTSAPLPGGRGRRSVIAVAPRFFATLLPDPAMLPLGEEVWGDTALKLSRPGGNAPEQCPDRRNGDRHRPRRPKRAPPCDRSAAAPPSPCWWKPVREHSSPARPPARRSSR